MSKKHQKQLPSFTLRAAQGRKEAQKSPGLKRWRAGRKQGHLLLRLRRPSSRSLVLIQPCAFFLRHLQLSRRPGNLFYLFTPVKLKPKSPRGVRTMSMAFETRMQPSLILHAAHISLHHLYVHVEQVTGMVTSIVVLRFARTPPPLCHSWKEFFSFCSWNGGGIARELFAVLPAASSSRRSTKAHQWLAVKAAVWCLLLTTNTADNKDHTLAKSLSMFETSTQKTNRRHPTPLTHHSWFARPGVWLFPTPSWGATKFFVFLVIDTTTSLFTSRRPTAVNFNSPVQVLSHCHFCNNHFAWECVRCLPLLIFLLAWLRTTSNKQSQNCLWLVSSSYGP